MLSRSLILTILGSRLTNAFPQAGTPSMDTTNQVVADFVESDSSETISAQVAPQSPTWKHDGPMFTLHPAVHWSHDMADMANLEPVETHTLYFTNTGSANSNQQHSFATMDANYTYPAVILEHSSYVSSVKCSANTINVTFNDPTAAETAQTSWSNIGQFLMVTSSNDCGTPNSDAHSYYMVSKVSFQGLDAICSVQEIQVADVIINVDLAWGQYNPNPTTITLNSPSGGSIVITGGGGGTGGNGTGGTGTGTNTTDTTGCGSLPAANINGFPAAPCGTSFDSTLDAILGYLPFDNADFASTLADIAPGLTDTNYEDYQDDDIVDSSENATISARRTVRKFQKRWGFSFKALAQSFVKAVSNTVSQVASTVKSVVSTAVEAVKSTVQAVVDTVSNLFDPSIDKTFNIDITPKKLVTSPWGQQFQLFKKEKDNSAGTASGSIALYCVDCGVTGKVHISGQVSFSILAGGISKGSVGLDGNIEAGLNLGLAAEATYKNSFKTPITSVGIPGFTIPNIITVGPVLALDAELDIGIEAVGQILVGTKVSIPNFGATLDLVSGQSSANGFTPVFTNRFEVSGEITATAGLGLPITVGIGLDIVPLGAKGRLLASIINKPGITATAKYAYSNTEPGDCNNGISYAINLVDETSYDLFNLKSGVIFPYKSPDLVSSCISLGSSPTSTPASSSTSSSTDASQATDTSGTNEVAGRAISSIHQDTVASLSKDRDNDDEDGEDEEMEQVNLHPRVPQATSTSSGAASTATGYASGTEALNKTDNMSDADYQELSALAYQDESNTGNTTNSDGSVYTQIKDSTNAYLLAAGDDGNFNLQAINNPDGSTTFVSYSNITISDDAERMMFYYPDVMTAYGVSRFRIASTDQIPKGTDMISLTPLDYDSSANTPGVYVALDSKQNVFYTVACNIQNQNTKIFLAKDPVASLQTLMRTDLRFIVTGGVVQSCSYMPFVSTGGGLGG